MLGVDYEHGIKNEWHELKVLLSFKKRLSCNEAILLAQFEKAFQVMNKTEGGWTYHSWHSPCWLRKYLEQKDFCNLMLIMKAIPTNSAWVERAYSKLEQVFLKRETKLTLDHLWDLFLLEILNLEPNGMYGVRKWDYRMLAERMRWILALNLIAEKRWLMLSSICLKLTVNILLFIYDLTKRKQF